MTGKELKAWREEVGLTQLQLAESIGVNSSTVARWERGEVPTPPVLSLALRKIRRETPEEYLRRVMKDQSLSYQQISALAKKSRHDISPSYVMQIAQGKVENPGVQTIKALAAGLGRPEVEVFSVFGAGDMDIVRDPELEAIQLNYAQLSERQRQKVKFVIEMLSREIRRLLTE